MRSEGRSPRANRENRLEAVVRLADPVDASSLERLHQGGFNLDPSYSPKRFQIGGDDSFVLVAELASAAVGYCEVEKSGANWWIDGLVVSESVRRSGIGTSLLSAALEKIPSSALVFLSVSSRNPAAVDLYQKFDFSEYRRDRRYVLLGRGSTKPTWLP